MAAGKEISEDAALGTVLLELDGIFIKEERLNHTVGFAQ